MQFTNLSEVKIENIKIKSLFRWPPGESDVLSALVLQMKEESSQNWNIWVTEFINNLSGNSHSAKKTVLVSSESASGKKHAQHWGNALSKYLGYPHICALKPQKGTANQKELSRLQRTQRVFDLNVEFSKPSNTRIIFVDDVVTTGQTALAAYNALKKPSNFEVWCLIYREL